MLSTSTGLASFVLLRGALLRDVQLSGGLALWLQGACGLVFALTHEESLVRRFRRFGRVIAIGRPGEPLPLPGASRAYLPLDDWQDTVSELIGHAHLVLLSVGPGPGTVWEYTETLRRLPPTRLVLLVYCAPEVYDAFRTAVTEEYARRSATEPGPWPPLPELPPFPAPAWPVRPRWNVWLNGGRSRLRWDFVLRPTGNWGAASQRPGCRLDGFSSVANAPQWLLRRHRPDSARTPLLLPPPIAGRS
ncbi:hypothetical protein [Kitasatospora sp. MMS16-BH015]|uniref:hypothetical protein n=1 Tax=Kitasatospora sp. MMS16-BH015 TaxID=2018025 RepID=UPI00131A5A5B|nr:hypothetical protein [Kitasatospora sp. MMS16-BH015]